MTKDEQIEFVQSVGMSAIERICNQIEQGDVPDDWTSIELQMLLSDRLDVAYLLRNSGKYTADILAHHLLP